MEKYQEAGKRVIEFMKHTNMTVERLSKIIGATESGIYRIRSGMKTYPFHTIYDLCIKVNMSMDWLITGEGNMFRDKSKRDVAEAEKRVEVMSSVLKNVTSVNEQQLKHIKELEEQIEYLNGELEFWSWKRKPKKKG